MNAPYVRIERPEARHAKDFLEAVRRSRALHGPWTRPPSTAAAYAAFLKRVRRSTHIGHFIVAEDGSLAGVVNISEVVLGLFRSAYLGYYAFSPWDGRGYMTAGLERVIRLAFRSYGLHRLEANIQPENVRSKRLVQRIGFRCEGFSPRYLKIAGRWRDHERWAITKEDFRARRATL